MVPYEPFDWADGPEGGTPITAAQLERMETQYAEVMADLAPVLSGLGTDIAQIGTDVAELGTDVDALEALTTTGRLGEDSLSATFVTALKPEKYGAVSDGETDDTAAFLSTLSAAATFGIHRIDLQGTYKIGRVPVNVPDLTIHGGTIIDGGFDIGLYGGSEYARLDVTIEGTKFERTTPSTTLDAITAQWAYGITVRQIHVVDYRAAFGVVEQPTDQNHHVARVFLSEVKTTGVQFVVYSPHTPSEDNSPLAELKIANSPEMAVLDTHLYLEGIDGLNVDSSVMLMPGFVDESDTKRWNIYIDRGQEISLGGGLKLFEAGYEAILMKRVQRVTIGPLHISYPGQRARSSGIKIDVGGPAEDQHVYGTITNPLIFFPSGDGVTFAGNVGHVACQAVVLTPGSSDRYYGEAGAFAADYIRAATTTRAIKVTGGEYSGTANARIALGGVLSETVWGSTTVNISPMGGTFGGNNWGTFVYGAAGARRRSSGAVNAFLQWYVDLKPGVYTFSMWHYQDTDAGIYTLAVDGIDRGTLDGYAAVATSAIGGITGISVPVGGQALITLQMKTKNASSSSYFGNLSGITLIRTSPFVP